MIAAQTSETAVDRLFRDWTEGLDKASPESLIGQAVATVARLQSELDACKQRLAESRLELHEISCQIEQGATLELSELDSLLQRQRLLQKHLRLNEDARESISQQQREAKARRGAQEERYKQCLRRLRSVEERMSSYPAEAIYQEHLGLITREIVELVGDAGVPALQRYAPPPVFKWSWV